MIDFKRSAFNIIHIIGLLRGIMLILADFRAAAQKKRVFDPPFAQRGPVQMQRTSPRLPAPFFRKQVLT